MNGFGSLPFEGDDKAWYRDATLSHMENAQICRYERLADETLSSHGDPFIQEES